MSGLTHRVVMAVDDGNELVDLLGAVPTPPPKPPMSSLWRGPTAWIRFVQHKSYEPHADQVRRICNQADAFSVAATEVGTLLDDAALVDAAAVLKQDSARLWSKRIDAMKLRDSARVVSDLLLPHHRKAQTGNL